MRSAGRQRLSDDKLVVHLNAMLTAVQYIDDLLKLSGENEVPQSLVQAHQLPNLEVRYGLQELRTHFT